MNTVDAGEQVLVEFVKRKLDLPNSQHWSRHSPYTVNTAFANSHCRKTFALVPTVKVRGERPN